MNLTNRLIFSVRKSMLAFDETVAAIEAAAGERGWQSAAAHDLQTDYEAAGRAEMTRMKNLTFAHPDAGVRLLVNDENKPMAALLPFGVSVYETSESEVFISALNLGRMSRMYDGEVQQALRQVATDFAEILQEFAEPDESVKAAKRWGGGCCLGCSLGCATFFVAAGGLFALTMVAFLKIASRLMRDDFDASAIYPGREPS